MESASGWMDNYEEAAQRKGPPPQDLGPPVSQANRPASTATATSSSLPNSAKKSKKRKPKKVPQSLPFVKQTFIADIIAGEELRAREAADGALPRSPSDLMFHPEEVIHFFQRFTFMVRARRQRGASDRLYSSAELCCCVHEPQVGKVRFIGRNKGHTWYCNQCIVWNFLLTHFVMEFARIF